jgi:hypothetical protein
MYIFIFNSRQDSGVVGFTPDVTGGNLPPEYAPWEPAKEGGAALIGKDIGPFGQGLSRDGYYIAVEREAIASFEMQH